MYVKTNLKIGQFINYSRIDNIPIVETTIEELEKYDKSDYEIFDDYWFPVDETNNTRIKFTIPITPRKKWWQFWKKDESKIAIRKLMSDYDQDIILPDEDIILPENN